MRTPLYDEHVKLNGKIVDFHGWDMPLYYDSIIKEHNFVRNGCGIFDVSHMGDIFIEGEGALKTLQYLLPTDVEKINNNDCVYTAFLNEEGNMIDDTIIYKFNNQKFLCVPNAATKDIILEHILKNNSGNAKIMDRSGELGCIAVQGPLSGEIMEENGFSFPDFFKFYEKDSFIISGTGYTGEKGCEIIAPNSDIIKIWRNLVNSLIKRNFGPCGLGSRDTLRMEKGMLLSGQDFNSDRTPYEASISFIVNSEKEYMGKEQLMKKTKPEFVFRGFISGDEKTIPRHLCNITKDDKIIGTVTSGSISPTLKKGIALGYIEKKYSKPDNNVQIIIRNSPHDFKVSKARMVP
ncbi:glycine cleavage system aminomethyltransferase GcvT [Cuniculiplasma sp. SKW4]|uniref:glycine cleavage system aminomethyltransferase GcvT n=1 Tax=Cuniculiplasma sp. SKW4 TaxID=3400171 RepID=UPI003FD0AD46